MTYRLSNPMTIVLIAVLFSSCPSFAESEITTLEQRPKFALLIGNDKYSDFPADAAPDYTPLLRLRNACNDVMAVAAKLQRIGWKEENIDYQCDLTKDQMRNRIDRFLDRVQDSNSATAVFYYSGHGIQVDKQNYIFGVDAKPNVEHATNTFLRDSHATLFSSDAVEIKWYLIDRLGGTFSNAILLVLDACRENPLLDQMNQMLSDKKATKSAPTLEWVVSTLKKPTKLNRGVVTAYSTSDGDLADDGTGSISPYASALSGGIRNNVTIDEILNETREEVSQLTKGSSREQTPDRAGQFQSPPTRCFNDCDSLMSKAGSLKLQKFASVATQIISGKSKRNDVNQWAVAEVVAPDPSKAVTTPLPVSRTLLDRSPKDLPSQSKPGLPFSQLSVDVFWCAQDSYSDSRRIIASEIASSIATLAKLTPSLNSSMISRVQIKPIPANVDVKKQFDPDRITLEYSAGQESSKAWANAIDRVSIEKLQLHANTEIPSNNLAVYVCKNVDINKRPQRVFVQIADPSQDQLARKVAKEIRGGGSFSVADGIDIQPAASHPDSEIRYFFKEDELSAERIASIVSANISIPAKLVFLPDYHEKVSQGAFEVWFGTKLLGSDSIANADGPMVRLNDVDAKDGEGNVVAKLSNITLSVLKGSGSQGPDYILKYSFYNGSGTQKGLQTVNVTLNGQSEKNLAVIAFPLDRSRCVYGGPEIRFQKGTLPAINENILSGELTVSRVTGVQGRC